MREILRWPSVERVDVVELDPVVIRLARQQPQLRRLNQDSLKDPRVIVHLGDAYAAVRNFKRRFDVVIADFLIRILAGGAALQRWVLWRGP